MDIVLIGALNKLRVRESHVGEGKPGSGSILAKFLSVCLCVTFLPLPLETVSPRVFMCLDEKSMQKNGGTCNLGPIGDFRCFFEK